MDAPDPKVNLRFLPTLSDPRNRGAAATAADHIKAMMETEGWKELTASVDAALHFEQRLLMVEAPGQRPDESYERKVGQWAGLRLAVGLADQLVARGEEASELMRAAEAA